MLAAKAGVLHHHRQRDLRVVGRGESHVQRVVALVLFHLGGVVFFLLADGHRLRRARLAAADVAGPGEDPRRGAFLRHPHQGAADDLHMLGLEAQVLRRLGRHRHADVAHRVLDAHDQLRRVLDAAIDQRGGGRCQLQHGEGVVALADAERNRLAGVPLLLLRLLVGLAFPGLAGQHAAHLTLDVDAGVLTEPQRRHEVVNGIDAKLVRQ